MLQDRPVKTAWSGVITLMLSLGLGAIFAAASAAENPSLRQALLAVPLTPALGGDTTQPVTGETAFALLAANAHAGRQRPFSFGNRLFNTNWTIAPGSVKSFDGLGPIFNRVSCSACHTRDGRGRPPEPGEPMLSMLTRLSIPGTGPHGGPNPHPAYGDQLGELANPGVAAEGQTKVSYTEIPGTYGDGSAYSLRRPAYEIVNPGYGPFGAGIMLSPRVAPAIFGDGLLEAVPATTLAALADPSDADGDGISGRVNEVFDPESGTAMPGRFGWKANVPTLTAQNTGAAFGDIGLTTDLHPDQNCSSAETACAAAPDGGSPELAPDFVTRLTLYTRLLAVPAQRNPGDAQVRRGAALFTQFQCSACHMPTLQSGDAALPELANQTFHPFTDLLLHDMGEGLADGRPDFLATGSEWRTAPLWGLGLIETVNRHELLLHDGRARGPAEAILWHGGEAEASREQFRNAAAADRDALLAFLDSL